MRAAVPLLIALAVPAPGPAIAAEPSAPFTIAETGQGFGDLQEAVSSIRMGTGMDLPRKSGEFP